MPVIPSTHLSLHARAGNNDGSNFLKLDVDASGDKFSGAVNVLGKTQRLIGVRSEPLKRFELSSALQGTLQATPTVLLNRGLCSDSVTSSPSVDGADGGEGSEEQKQEQQSSEQSIECINLGDGSGPSFRFSGWAQYTIEAWIRPLPLAKPAEQVRVQQCF